MRRPRVAGVSLQYPTICARCGKHMPAGTRAIRRKNGYIHPSCASGQDDE